MYIIRGLLQSKQLKQHMFNIWFYQSLSNSAIYEHRFLENIKNLYKSAGKCDDQQHYKAIIESETVSTPEGCTDNSPM